MLNRWVKILKKNGRAYWWCQVIEQQGDLIRVGNNKNAGRPWWTKIDQTVEILPHLDKPAPITARRRY
jgi:hypothetical protein